MVALPMRGIAPPFVLLTNLCMLLIGIAIGANHFSAAARKDASLTRADFAAACDEDITGALFHEVRYNRVQTKTALMRIPGMKPGTKSQASGRCYEFMRALNVN